MAKVIGNYFFDASMEPRLLQWLPMAALLHWDWDNASFAAS